MSAIDAAVRIGAAAVRRTVDRLFESARADLPEGVSIERIEDGLVLTGKRLRMRSLTDARLRGFGR